MQLCVSHWFIVLKLVMTRKAENAGEGDKGPAAAKELEAMHLVILC